MRYLILTKESIKEITENWILDTAKIDNEIAEVKEFISTLSTTSLDEVYSDHLIYTGSVHSYCRGLLPYRCYLARSLADKEYLSEINLSSDELTHLTDIVKEAKAYYSTLRRLEKELTDWKRSQAKSSSRVHHINFRKAISKTNLFK